MIFSAFITIAIALSSPTGIFGCSDQCCDLNCWEQCFVEGDPDHSAIYQQIYQIVQTIRNLYTPCSKPHGTCFLLDSTTFNSLLNGNDLMDYERNLASIIALTEPVSDDCNPFFLNKFYHWFAFYAHKWQCKDKCAAAATLASSWVDHHINQPGASSSWITGGCILCRHAMNNPGQHACSGNTTNELLVAIANSDIRYLPPASNWKPCDRYNRVIIGTHKASDLGQMVKWASPGLAYQLTANDVNLKATKALLKCMNHRCCPNHKPGQFPLPARSAESEAVQNIPYLSVNKEGRPTEVKEFKGTFSKFQEEIQKEVVKIDSACGSCTGCLAKNGRCYAMSYKLCKKYERHGFKWCPGKKGRNLDGSDADLMMDFDGLDVDPILDLDESDVDSMLDLDESDVDSMLDTEI